MYEIEGAEGVIPDEVGAPPLIVDRDQMAAFVDALFRHADVGTYVQFRAFYHEIPAGANNTIFGSFPFPSVRLTSDRSSLVDAAAAFAQQCADAPSPVVFCPPVV